MHILFKSGKNDLINKLLNVENMNLLIENDENNKCCIDYMNNTNLKKIIQECIKSNEILNKNIFEMKNNFTIFNENFYSISKLIMVSTLLLTIYNNK